ncbi:hypothetical protein M431DRAFT_486627 [Trichoderma harzianum CBS 226.95]|uniref:Uncharacterized protein n=1 Tax=Trichoderma harzianum CBS 226.95 TaxID=983964 RepID=A0A2T3ZXT6_TRIHA|nr:hypothetical protein M431DRAFT_486627 [Trichoderma harzianum CBS 226.95]PTB49630.1 hypothetical protein M431DRAFT_486627 [Trichoderma harzianum CBS 226.95]
MACTPLDGFLPVGGCSIVSSDPTSMVTAFKKCCGPAPVVQYYTNDTIGCGAYCPIVSNGPNCTEVQDCLFDEMGVSVCTGDGPASPSALSRVSAMASATVCAVCAACVATAAPTSTNAATGVYNSDITSWKTGINIGAILFSEIFTGFLL